jgi:hypothetical protein
MNRRVPAGTLGGVRGRLPKIKGSLLLDFPKKPFDKKNHSFGQKTPTFVLKLLPNLF